MFFSLDDNPPNIKSVNEISPPKLTHLRSHSNHPKALDKKESPTDRCSLTRTALGRIEST